HLVSRPFERHQARIVDGQVEAIAEGANWIFKGGDSGAGRRAVVRVAFFGSPEFAVPSLEALLGEGFEVIAVVSQPDRPQGRSWSQPVAPPVKRAAQEEDVPVLQPERPSDPAFVEKLRALAPDIGVVVAYGHILKPELLA